MIIKNYKDYINFINEGLIKTLDGNKALEYLLHTLSSLNFNVKGTFNDNKISFTVNNYDKIQNNRIDYLFDTISSIMTNLYGWFPSAMIIKNEKESILHKYFDESYLKSHKDSISCITIEFDSKFDEIVNNKFDKLYHLSIMEYNDKIIKYGLSPRSKSKLSSHIDRIYLCKSIDNCKILIPQMKLYYFEEKDNNIYKLGNKKYKKNIKWIIYEINNSNDIILYKNPIYLNGFYTLENISPENINEIEREI